MLGHLQNERSYRHLGKGCSLAPTSVRQEVSLGNFDARVDQEYPFIISGRNDRGISTKLTKLARMPSYSGVQNAVTNAIQIGANSFALFLKSQRKWDNPPLSNEARDLFISNCKTHGYSAAQHSLPHGSYLVNLAQADEGKATQAYNSFVDDLKRCEELGIMLYNFHPGSTGGDARPAAIKRIAMRLNRSHKATKSVVTVLENMAGAGNVIGSTWEDLRDIIALVEDRDRVGVCIDTCHAFAAGHDLRTPEAFKDTIEAFEQIVGLKYLKAFHCKWCRSRAC